VACRKPCDRPRPQATREDHLELLLLRPQEEELHYPVSELAAKYGASAANETYDPDEAYADWPGEYRPLRLPWPL
jgi:hypothetical protein